MLPVYPLARGTHVSRDAGDVGSVYSRWRGEHGIELAIGRPVDGLSRWRGEHSKRNSLNLNSNYHSQNSTNISVFFKIGNCLILLIKETTISCTNSHFTNV